MCIAIANGLLRQSVISQIFSELTAHQISTFTAILFMFLAVWLVQKIWPLASAKQAWQIGLIWLAMTIAFEFIFGHFVVGHSWERLLHDYNLFRGRIWVLFLIAITSLPYVVYSLARKS
jgi:hypothetical protein